MITQHNQRVFFSNNGSLEDITLRANDFLKGSFDLGGYTAGEDYIYIGSDLPFSHKLILLDAPNSNLTSPKVEYWTGSVWQTAVDVLDGTDQNYDGTSLSQSGVISWKTDIEESAWGEEGDTNDIAELSTLRIFCFYWMRLSWDQDLSIGTSLSHIGYDFAVSDDALYTYYPDLNNQDFRDSFVPTEPSGTKTDWLHQRLTASANVCNYLRGKSIINSPAQLMDHEIFREATIHETARIIYAGLDTEAYAEDYKRAGERFGRAINMKKFNVDKNQSGNLEPREARTSVTFLGR